MQGLSFQVNFSTGQFAISSDGFALAGQFSNSVLNVSAFQFGQGSQAFLPAPPKLKPPRKRKPKKLA